MTPDFSVLAEPSPVVTEPQPSNPPARPRRLDRLRHPARSDLALAGIAILAAVLYVWGLGGVGYGNTYYAAAVKAGTKSWKAFFFGSIDPGNFIAVDKPPAALWVQMLGRTPTYQPWLRTVVLAGDLLGAAGMWLAYHRPRWLWLMAGAGVAAVSLLAGPAAYAVTTINQGNAGVNASAGPAVTAAAGTVGAGPFGGLPAGTAPAGRGEVGARAAARGSATAETALIAYLEANRGSATYLVATFGSMSSASIIIATGQPVMTIGGFNGSDPAPTLAQFQRLVAEGEVRYVLVSGAGGGFGGGGPGGGSATSQAISQWVTSHGKKVPP